MKATSDTSQNLVKAREFLEKGFYDQARELYQELIDNNPENADGWHGLACVFLREGHKYYDAIQSIEKAIAIAGPKAMYHHNIGVAKIGLGRFAEAIAHFEEAIRLKPDYAEAYFSLTGIKNFKTEEGFHTKINALINSGSFSDSDLSFLHFAAGKVYDDIRNYDAAFSHFQQGNQLRKIDYKREKLNKFIEDTIRVFDKKFVRKIENIGFHDRRIAFIVGMPRSGTTLVEQILASHSDICSLGELPDIPAISGELKKHTKSDASYPFSITEVPANIIKGFGRGYVQRVLSIATEGLKLYFIDKAPNNFTLLGLIAAILPKAKIIHCRRNPLDTCLSCYFQNFRFAQYYSFNLEDLAEYYAGYQKLMEHWKSVLKLPMFEIDYEQLVVEPEKFSKKLIDYLELQWEENCLQMKAERKLVRTASLWQVRQPIYNSSVEKWRNYEKHLGPLITALKNKGVKLDLEKSK